MAIPVLDPCCCFDTSRPFNINCPGTVVVRSLVDGEYINSYDTGHSRICDLMPIDDDLIVSGLFNGGANLQSSWGVGGVCRFDVIKERIWDAALPRWEGVGHDFHPGAGNTIFDEAWAPHTIDIDHRAYVRREAGVGVYYFCRIDSDGAETATPWINEAYGRVWASRFSTDVAVTSIRGPGPPITNTVPILSKFQDDGTEVWKLDPVPKPGGHLGRARCVALTGGGNAWIIAAGGSLETVFNLARVDAGGLLEHYTGGFLAGVGIGDPINLVVIEERDILLLSGISFPSAQYKLTRFVNGAAVWTVNVQGATNPLFGSFTDTLFQIDYNESSDVCVVLFSNASVSLVRQYTMSTGALVRTHPVYKMQCAASIYIRDDELWIGGVRGGTPAGKI